MAAKISKEAQRKAIREKAQQDDARKKAQREAKRDFEIRTKRKLYGKGTE